MYSANDLGEREMQLLVGLRLCVCMYTYMYIYIYIYIYEYIHIHKYVCLCVCVHIYSANDLGEREMQSLVGLPLPGHMFSENQVCASCV